MMTTEETLLAKQCGDDDDDDDDSKYISSIEKTTDEEKILNLPLLKRVKFSDQPHRIHIMWVWSFAARQARVGEWDRYAINRDRFRRRIAEVDSAVSWILNPVHRSKIMLRYTKNPT
ncbi:hypothetical protein [Trichoplusia ni ascovirus 2c]|uniref:hypothetical protein n=1 Tax=Trichoplusia ni ascovirus 2c TaxID=328615 RepID=UPI0000E4422E|nr:hypothetical protein TNAV2c_gp086 [Trichoplusia ni ascovirus 2c]ABF70603.1 hypothetical protein [Trichoplusia ni ascovirus 2c]AUS94191.1 hypothetical protein [Trichoplusia ni ascovirus 6b]